MSDNFTTLVPEGHVRRGRLFPEKKKKNYLRPLACYAPSNIFFILCHRWVPVLSFQRNSGSICRKDNERDKCVGRERKKIV